MHGRTRRALCVGLALLAGCAAGQGGDEAQDELQALLRDEPLSAAVTPPVKVAAIEQPPALLPERLWKFDDCNPDRAELFAVATPEIAFRSVGVTCTPGVLGQAVKLAAEKDIVYVPDQPFFTFESGVSVAGWFQPEGIDRTQTLFASATRTPARLR